MEERNKWHEALSRYYIVHIFVHERNKTKHLLERSSGTTNLT
jgi:hypothetical protein